MLAVKEYLLKFTGWLLSTVRAFSCMHALCTPVFGKMSPQRIISEALALLQQSGMLPNTRELTQTFPVMSEKGLWHMHYWHVAWHPTDTMWCPDTNAVSPVNSYDLTHDKCVFVSSVSIGFYRKSSNYLCKNHRVKYSNENSALHCVKLCH